MKNIKCSLSLFVLLALCLTACDSDSKKTSNESTDVDVVQPVKKVVAAKPVAKIEYSEPELEPTPQDTEPKHTLWKVNGDKNDVYLLGTIHVLRKSDYPLAAVYDEAFADAENIVLEINENEGDLETMQQLILDLGVYTDGTTLEDHIPADKYKILVKAAQTHKLSMSLLNMMEPWMSSVSYTAMLYSQLGLDSKYGVDKHFKNRAIEAKKTVISLETPEQQMQMLDGLSIELQTDMLIDFVENFNEQEALIIKLHKSWIDGNENGIIESSITELKKFEELYDVMLKNRNDAWMNDIKPMLKAQDDYMIAVGAAHMYGEDGLLKQISDLGYEIEQM